MKQLHKYRSSRVLCTYSVLLLLPKIEGYVTIVQYDAIAAWANRHHIATVQILVQPGDYLHEGAVADYAFINKGKYRQYDNNQS